MVIETKIDGRPVCFKAKDYLEAGETLAELLAMIFAQSK